jgi:hypothetical protein
MRFARALPPACFLAAAMVRAEPPGIPAPDLRFGVMTHFAQGWDPSWIIPMTDAAIPTVRDELYWARVEPGPGRFVFPPAYDHYMAELRRHGIDPLVVLSFANPGYDGGMTPYTEQGFSAYARYGTELLKHYGNQIDAVEIWNEYNGSFCKGPAEKARAATYLAMLRTAYLAIKRERPDVTVVGGATSGIPGPYWRKLITGGGLAHMDAVSVHPYRYRAPPEGMEDEIVRLRALMQKYDPGNPRPIWATEIGWETHSSQAPGDLAIDDVTQAKFLVRGYALLLSAGVARIYWYLLHDEHGLTMGLTRDNAARTPRPAFAAMATMIRELREARFVRREASLPGLYSLVFERPSGVEVRVMWSLQPIAVQASGAESGEDYLGQKLAVLSPLNLTDAPVFVQGPLRDLPPAPPPVVDNILTDSARDFSDRQGKNGWTYGSITGDSSSFVPMTDYEVTDWKEAWVDPGSNLSISSEDQHPAATRAHRQVAAVRRWTSPAGGRIRVSGHFRCQTLGDGVGVGILVDGNRQFRKLLGGGHPVLDAFDFVKQVHPGSVIDIAVDPGPATDINYDATAVEVIIRKEPADE